MIDIVTFNAAQLLKEPVGATRQTEVWADLGRLVPDLQVEASEEPAEISGPIRLMHTTEGVLVQGRLEAILELPCDRCLEPVPIEVGVDFEETFAPTVDISTGRSVTPEEEDRALWIDGHHVLDLSEVLRQNLLVSLPTQNLCEAKCRGLCPQCGQNLNLGTCECKSETDPRWSALANLLGDP